MLRFLCILAFAWSAVSIAADKVDFAKDVWPILQDRCVKCHRAPYESRGRMKKPKGELRMDTKELLMKGGEDGACLEPGKPEKSSFYKMIMLPEDHDDVMPPKGGPLTDKQKAIIKQWIEEGCNFGDWTEGKYEEK